jgi:hypothetical protein
MEGGEMKEYIITEEELRKFYAKTWQGQSFDDFLKSKKPVERLERKRNARAVQIYKKIEKYVENINGNDVIKGREYIIFKDGLPITELSLELADLIPQQKAIDKPEVVREAIIKGIEKSDDYFNSEEWDKKFNEENEVTNE